MDGIVILASSLIEKDHPIFSQIALLLLIPFFLSMVIGIPCATYGKNLIAAICAFLFILCSLSAIGFEIASQKFSVPAYVKYEVILDDSVSMNEFMEKYEVLEQRDKIYVIKEK